MQTNPQVKKWYIIAAVAVAGLLTGYCIWSMFWPVGIPAPEDVEAIRITNKAFLDGNELPAFDVPPEHVPRIIETLRPAKPDYSFNDEKWAVYFVLELH